MRNWCGLLVCLVLLFCFVPSMHGQAIFAATETAHIQAGAGAMYLQSDYASTVSEGVAFWADYDICALLGLEGEGRLGGMMAPAGIGENSYLLGPRLLYHRRRFTAYGKLMAGRASISDHVLNQSSTFNVYAFGCGLEYKVSRKLNIRVADVERQRWPDFPSSPLAPLAITVGLSYVLR